MTSQRPGHAPAAGAGRNAVPLASSLPGRRLTAVMLLAAAALDLARCGVVVATARHAGPAIGLVAAGLAAAAVSLWTARAFRGGRRWPAWAALLIGVASAPQAAASGFHSPYTIPDTVTAALGVLLAVTVLATASPAVPAGQCPEGPCAIGQRLTPMTRSVPRRPVAAGGSGAGWNIRRTSAGSGVRSCVSGRSRGGRSRSGTGS